MKSIVAADLFAGAGGTSTALSLACAELGLKLRLTAVNHWPVAIETHAANHPGADHICQTLDSVDPGKTIRGRLDVLCASPECTHHSNARGGKPISDQSRATAWHVVRWAEALRPRVILIENVREMLTWGPLGANGRPLVKRKGDVFAAWVAAIESLGYTVSHRLVNAANFGGATTRTRLFIIAVRGRGPVPWATPTHERVHTTGLFDPLKPWRQAREIIDWKLLGKSILGRKHPLKPNTIERIAEGIRQFWRLDPEPFLIRLRGTAAGQVASSAMPISEPLPTLTAGGNHIGLCQPFMLGQQSGATPRPISQPIPTVAGAGAISLITPFLMHTTHHGGDRVHSLDEPVPCITGANRGEQALIQPFIIPTNFGERDGQRPRTHSIDSPLPTIVGSVTHGVIEPFLVSYYGNGGAHSIADPLDTITGRDRFGLVAPSGEVIADILFRMLQPHELAAGMGFPSDYRFCGNRSDVVKQIGNAVEINKAKAHLHALLLAMVA